MQQEGTIQCTTVAKRISVRSWTLDGLSHFVLNNDSYNGAVLIITVHST